MHTRSTNINLPHYDINYTFLNIIEHISAIKNASKLHIRIMHRSMTLFYSSRICFMTVEFAAVKQSEGFQLFPVC